MWCVGISLLRNRNYLIYNAKISATNFGYTLYMITIPAYSYVVSGSILFTGLVLFVEYGIYTLTFITGPIVDKVKDKRYLLVVAEAGIGISALFLGLMMQSGNLSRTIFLVLVGIIALCWDFVWTADYTVLPLIVDKEDIPKANGYSNALGNGHVAAGLAVGGFLFVVVGAYGSILIYSACLFLASILSILIPLVIFEEERKLGNGFMKGWKYVFKENRGLLLLTLVVTVFAFFGSASALAIAKVFAATSQLWYSIMFSMYYIGSMLVGVLIGKFFPVRSFGKAVLATYSASGVLITASVILRGNLLLDAVLWFSLGLLLTAHYPLYSTYLQRVTNKEMLGRTAANLYTFRGISSTSGTLLIPVLITSLGLDTTFEFFGIFMVAAVLLIFLASPGMRGLSLPRSEPD